MLESTEPYHWFLLGAVWGALQVYFYPMFYRDWKRRRGQRKREAAEEVELNARVWREWLPDDGANESPEPGVYLDGVGEWQSGPESFDG